MQERLHAADRLPLLGRKQQCGQATMGMRTSKVVSLDQLIDERNARRKGVRPLTCLPGVRKNSLTVDENHRAEIHQDREEQAAQDTLGRGLA